MIHTETTPNPDSLKFVTENTISDVGTEEFQKNDINKIKNPFIKEILNFKGVELILLSKNFLSVKKTKEVTWNELKPTVISHLNDYFENNKDPILQNESKVKKNQLDSDETIQKINNGSLAEKTIVLTDTSGVGVRGLSQKPTEGSLKITSFTASTITIEEKQYGVKYQFTYDRSEGSAKPKAMQVISLYFNENPKGDHITSNKGKPVDAWNYKYFDWADSGSEVTENNGCE